MKTNQGSPVKIQTPAELRTILTQAMVGVLEGRVNVSQANAITGLSCELHKSIRQEWDMRCYVAENLTYNQARLVRDTIDPEMDVENLPRTIAMESEDE